MGKSCGYILAMPNDTVVTYNLPEDIYQFPTAYFYNRQLTCAFPDTAWNDYPVDLYYHGASTPEKKYNVCTADVWLGLFVVLMKDRQIVIDCIKKPTP